MDQPNMMQRLIRYCQGLFGIKMNQTEMGRADIVYHNAIQDRVKQHHELKSALSRLIILRNRADARSSTLGEDLLVVETALNKAAQTGDEDRGPSYSKNATRFKPPSRRLRSKVVGLANK